MRVLCSRAAQLVDDFGLAKGDGGGHAAGAGLTTEAVMGYVEENGCATHNVHEVREAAKELTVAVYLRAGAEVG